jgi:hypothetical protein
MSVGPCSEMEVLPSALCRMLQLLSRPLLHLLSRPLMQFYPRQMLQLLGLWRLHRGRAPPLGQLESPRLCQRWQLLARPPLQLLSRPGITMATELHQLEQSRPLCPQMPRRL